MITNWKLPLFQVMHLKVCSHHEYPRGGHSLRRPGGLGLGITDNSEVLKSVFGSTKASFTAGLVSAPNAALITHERAIPPGPVSVSTTLPRGHMPCGVQSSRIHTSSCFSLVSSFWSHLVRLIRVGAYSFSSRFQKLSTWSLVSFQELLLNLLPFVWS